MTVVQTLLGAHRSAAESPPGEREKGAAPSNATPACDMDLQLPDQRQMSCPPLS
jgi:hypothetical protein